MTRRTSYERTSERLLALPCLPDRPFCLFRDGRLLVGSQSKHRYANARKWRTFWRIKTNRREDNHG